MNDPLAPTAAENVWETPTTVVKVSLKAGPYEAPWITLDASNLGEMLHQFGPELAELMKQTTEAQASFTRMWNKAKDAKVPTPGNYGKPQGADNSNGTSIPFADVDDTPDPSKCKHGDRTFVEHGGKRGWVCPMPKGSEGRCTTEFV